VGKRARHCRRNFARRRAFAHADRLRRWTAWAKARNRHRERSRRARRLCPPLYFPMVAPLSRCALEIQARHENLQNRRHPGRRHRQRSHRGRDRGPGSACGARRQLAFTFDHFDWGSDYYKRHGVMMPPDGRDQIKDHDAIYFGAVGAPDVPDHITLWGRRLAICQPFDQYANVRPTRILPGITSPLRHVAGPELDWVIVRENSEGEYAGVGGARPSGPAGGSRDRRIDDDPCRRRPHHALCVPAGAIAAAQAAHRGHEVERPAPRHGDVGRDRHRRSRANSPT